MMDHTLGIAATSRIDGWAPTISLDMEYIRPANIGDALLATASIIAMGRRIIRMQGRLINEETGKLFGEIVFSSNL
jgi:acyl-coenzyme A thioesterase PaaI-like protein